MIDTMKKYDTGEMTKVFEDDLLCLHRITLPPPMRGYRDFLTPWLLQAEGRTFVVDVGPRSTLQFLVSCLKGLGVDSVDYVLLTHVHLDHAGGIADFLSEYPETRIVAHPKGQPHLVDPSRLLEGSLETLGENVVRAYGGISSIPDTSVLKAPWDIDSLCAIGSPGHASHHQSYLCFSGGKRILFVGEAAGVYYPPEYFLEMSTDSHKVAGNHGDFYLRPATPPRFFWEATMGSIQKAREAAPELVCYGHYGYSWEPMALMELAQEQMVTWRAVLSEVVKEGLGPEVGVHRLLKEDPLLALFGRFPDDIRERESYFLRNSVLGFMGYLASGQTRKEEPV